MGEEERNKQQTAFFSARGPWTAPDTIFKMFCHFRFTRRACPGVTSNTPSDSESHNVRSLDVLTLIYI